MKSFKFLVTFFVVIVYLIAVALVAALPANRLLTNVTLSLPLVSPGFECIKFVDITYAC